LRSRIAVVGEPKWLDLRERQAVPIARYFIFVGSALAALLFIAGWCLPTPPAMFADQLAIDRASIRIKSARKWPEKIVLDTSQPAILPAVEEPAAAESARLPPDEAGDQSNLEAMAQLKTYRQPLSILQPRKSSAEWQRPLDQSGWPAVPLHVDWQERKRVGAVASSDGSTMVRQARMPCRAGTPRRHGLWIGRRLPGGIER
jgi:hypothetical protein